MKTLGEWREEIEQGEEIVGILQGAYGDRLREALDGNFPAGSVDIVDAGQLKGRAILCGNALARNAEDRAGIMFGGEVQIQVLQLLGFSDDARQLRDKLIEYESR